MNTITNATTAPSISQSSSQSTSQSTAQSMSISSLPVMVIGGAVAIGAISLGLALQWWTKKGPMDEESPVLSGVSQSMATGTLTTTPNATTIPGKNVNTASTVSSTSHSSNANNANTVKDLKIASNEVMERKKESRPRTSLGATEDVQSIKGKEMAVEDVSRGRTKLRQGSKSPSSTSLSTANHSSSTPYHSSSTHPKEAITPPSPALSSSTTSSTSMNHPTKSYHYYQSSLSLTYLGHCGWTIRTSDVEIIVDPLQMINTSVSLGNKGMRLTPIIYDSVMGLMSSSTPSAMDWYSLIPSSTSSTSSSTSSSILLFTRSRSDRLSLPTLKKLIHPNTIILTPPNLNSTVNNINSSSSTPALPSILRVLQAAGYASKTSVTSSMVLGSTVIRLYYAQPSLIKWSDENFDAPNNSDPKIESILLPGQSGATVILIQHHSSFIIINGGGCGDLLLSENQWIVNDINSHMQSLRNEEHLNGDQKKHCVYIGPSSIYSEVGGAWMMNTFVTSTSTPTPTPTTASVLYTSAFTQSAALFQSNTTIPCGGPLYFMDSLLSHWNYNKNLLLAPNVYPDIWDSIWSTNNNHPSSIIHHPSSIIYALPGASWKLNKKNGIEVIDASINNPSAILHHSLSIQSFLQSSNTPYHQYNSSNVSRSSLAHSALLFTRLIRPFLRTFGPLLLRWIEFHWKTTVATAVLPDVDVWIRTHPLLFKISLGTGSVERCDNTVSSKGEGMNGASSTRSSSSHPSSTPSSSNKLIVELRLPSWLFENIVASVNDGDWEELFLSMRVVIVIVQTPPWMMEVLVTENEDFIRIAQSISQSTSQSTAQAKCQSMSESLHLNPHHWYWILSLFRCLNEQRLQSWLAPSVNGDPDSLANFIAAVVKSSPSSSPRISPRPTPLSSPRDRPSTPTQLTSATIMTHENEGRNLPTFTSSVSLQSQSPSSTQSSSIIHHPSSTIGISRGSTPPLQKIILNPSSTSPTSSTSPPPSSTCASSKIIVLHASPKSTKQSLNRSSSTHLSSAPSSSTIHHSSSTPSSSTKFSTFDLAGYRIQNSCPVEGASVDLLTNCLLRRAPNEDSLAVLCNSCQGMWRLNDGSPVIWSSIVHHPSSTANHSSSLKHFHDSRLKTVKI